MAERDTAKHSCNIPARFSSDAMTEKENDLYAKGHLPSFNEEPCLSFF